ncbi:transporter substrate-binding domain-containing protein [Kitasatospora sp. NPDC059646]|uniref:transporter substrate-binding domain-containing protein n=1 Tax=Kitasatospora sp. NPDC059646 TaxID=3346893 RepID=UPI00369B59CB
MHIPRPARLAACLLLLSAAAFGCSEDSKPDPFDADPIKIGFKDGRPGMSVLTGKGDYVGFEPHVAQKVVQGLLHRDFTSLPVTTANWKEALLDGKTNHNKVDLVIADISEQDSLKNDFDLAGPYLQTPLGVLLKASDSREVNKAEDLRPLAVCAQEYTTAYNTLVANGGRPPVTATDLSGCIDRLDDGTADAVLADFVVLQGIAVNSGTGTSHAYRVPRNARIGRPQYLMMMLPKGHRKACELLRQAIADYLNDTDWTTTLKENLGLTDFTNEEINDTFHPVTTSVGDRCSA